MGGVTKKLKLQRRGSAEMFKAPTLPGFFRMEYFAPDQNILHYSPDWNILQYAPYQTILYYFPDQNILYYSLDLNILHHSPDSLRSRPEPERYLEIEDGNLPQGLNPLYTAVR